MHAHWQVISTTGQQKGCMPTPEAYSPDLLRALGTPQVLVGCWLLLQQWLLGHLDLGYAGAAAVGAEPAAANAPAVGEAAVAVAVAVAVAPAAREAPVAVAVAAAMLQSPSAAACAVPPVLPACTA